MQIFADDFERPFLLKGTGTVIGFDADGIAGVTAAFRASPPIPGKICITQIIAIAGSNAQATNTHRVRFALATELPATEAEFAKAEPIFPAAATTAGETQDFHWGSLAGLPAIDIFRVLTPNGRRLVCRLFNGRNSTVTMYAALVICRVVGGDRHRIESLLSGEQLRK